MKLTEITGQNLATNLTVEQRAFIFADYIKANKADAERIFKSELPEAFKNERLEENEQEIARLQEQIKEFQKTPKDRDLLDGQTKKPVLTLGEYLQIMAKKELVRKEPNIRLTNEEINKFNEVTKSATSGLTDGDFSSGGALLTEQYAVELLKAGYESAGLINLAKPYTTTSNSLKIKYIKDYDRSGGYVAGGVAMSWVDELGTATATKPVTDEMEIELKKLMGFSYQSQEQIEDSPYSIEQQMRADFAEAFALTMDDGMLNGIGTKDIQGIIKSPALYSVGVEAGQTTTDPFVPQNVMKMWSHSTSSAKRRGVWLFNGDVMPYLPQMNLTIGTGGAPVFLPMNSLANQPYMTIYGRPLIECEGCQAVNTQGDIFFVDFSRYAILTKTGGALRYDTSIHVEFLYDNMCFRFIYRIGGQGLDATYQTPLHGTTYKSPFVTLDTRS